MHFTLIGRIAAERHIEVAGTHVEAVAIGQGINDRSVADERFGRLGNDWNRCRSADADVTAERQAAADHIHFVLVFRRDLNAAAGIHCRAEEARPTNHFRTFDEAPGGDVHDVDVNPSGDSHRAGTSQAGSHRSDIFRRE